MHPPRPRRTFSTTGLVSALVGVVLFAWLVKRAGPADIWAGLVQIGWGMLAIIAVAGLRFAIRALAWALAIEPPHQLRFRDAFPAVVSGDAFGNLTPLGPIVGEPAKAAFVQGRLPLGSAITGLAVENIIYTLSAAAMIAASMAALLVTFQLPAAQREASEIAILGISACFVAALWILIRRPTVVSGVLARLAPAGSAVYARLDRVRALEHQVATFASRRTATALMLVGAELGFHALGVIEIYITWWLMQGAPPTLLTAFVLEGANRLITVVFKFVPLQVGVAEFGTGAFTELLGFGIAPGTTLAIARKIRVLFWTFAGTVLLVKRGLGPGVSKQ